MDKEKWMTFIQHLWAIIGYWQLTRYFRDNNPHGAFFNFTAYAVRDKLIMLIAHTVNLCEVIAKDFPIGDEARAVLKEIQTLYNKEYQSSRPTRVNYEDCGVRVFRDYILAHPLDHIKELLGKDPYRVALKWDTVEHTLDKIKGFAIAVEKHHEPSWNLETGKEEIGSVTDGCQQLSLWLQQAARYEELQRNLILNPEHKATVAWDFNKREIVIVS